MNFCECDNEGCRHGHQFCASKQDLRLYRVAGVRQTLCATCAGVARRFCLIYGHTMDTLTSAAEQRRRDWSIDDWFCASVLLGSILWIVIEILPAFFDGRVAQVVGR